MAEEEPGNTPFEETRLGKKHARREKDELIRVFLMGIVDITRIALHPNHELHGELKAVFDYNIGEGGIHAQMWSVTQELVEQNLADQKIVTRLRGFLSEQGPALTNEYEQKARDYLKNNPQDVNVWAQRVAGSRGRYFQEQRHRRN